MFNLREKFQFIEDGLDFPFYNDKPMLSTSDWIVLTIGVLTFASMVFIPFNFSDVTNELLFFLVTFLPISYVCRGNLKIFFKKPKIGDVKTIIYCYVGYIIYSLLILAILDSIGYVTSTNSIVVNRMDIVSGFSILLQILGEEFFKISLLLIVMYLVYKFTDNRSLAIYLSILATLLSFGLIHIGSYGKLLQILLIQGFGSIFDLYSYMKTKNVLISYILHVIIDLPLLLVLFGVIFYS